MRTRANADMPRCSALHRLFGCTTMTRGAAVTGSGALARVATSRNGCTASTTSTRTPSIVGASKVCRHRTAAPWSARKVRLTYFQHVPAKPRLIYARQKRARLLAFLYAPLSHGRLSCLARCYMLTCSFFLSFPPSFLPFFCCWGGWFGSSITSWGG